MSIPVIFQKDKTKKLFHADFEANGFIQDTYTQGATDINRFKKQKMYLACLMRVAIMTGTVTVTISSCDEKGNWYIAERVPYQMTQVK